MRLDVEVLEQGANSATGDSVWLQSYTGFKCHVGPPQKLDFEALCAEISRDLVTLSIHFPAA